ncbi:MULTISPECIES: hypothetical protein [Microbacterium]|uniref:hypothetical protein n=1 Tax=Microbacterium TaxID=33882 RepID=UPI00146B5ACE|nr:MULTISPECIES: hypothetical protein [Microbacterium]
MHPLDILARGGPPAGRLAPGVGLTFASRQTAAAIAVIPAAIVLALDDSGFAITSLSIAFAVVVGTGVFVRLKHSRTVVALGATTRATG